MHSKHSLCRVSQHTFAFYSISCTCAGRKYQHQRLTFIPSIENDCITLIEVTTCKCAPFQLQAIGYTGSYASTIMALEDRPKFFLHQVRVVKRGFMNVGREPSL